jgi:hypothetical protein
MQIARSRHELGRLLARVFGHLQDAETLLRPKALRSPASAEADAWRRTAEALKLIGGWATSAGPTVCDARELHELEALK